MPEPCSRESYDTGLIFVGDHTIKNKVIAPYAIALAGALATSPSTFCDRLAVSGGPSTDGDSLPDAYEACVVTIETVTNLTAAYLIGQILLAPGGEQAVEDLIDEHVDKGSAPTPEEEASPPPPMAPPPGWEQDNPCEIPIKNIEAALQTAKIKSHLWGARRGKSEFYPWAARRLEWLLAVAAAKELPVPRNGRCERIVDYGVAHVGIDRDLQEPTTIYTVVTETNGNLFNMYPGVLADLAG